MRYPEDHKAETHKRIVAEAARRFRADGIDATGLQPLMKALGLTHGGFYAHFKSKDALVEEALQAAADNASAHWDKAFGKEQPLKAFFERYLSPEHRAHPEQGCPLPTMSAELGQRGHASPITDSVLNSLLSRLEKATGNPEQSLAMVSTLVGALTLSRSVASEALSDRILDSARQTLIAQVEAAEASRS
ncbi:TetR/AcrR family transcriptional regulator [Metapseudomonas furukawaii]|jgi:AcrR family transcriptional regulator|uniref:Transcriptional regulator n=1 Tax=Metapseudomonas furukawaii TaxID=1149133 RepID=A0AAD1C2A3_METFU|nr:MULTISPECIES: TetR/AcrR family transcriptional regulator [Pseudomonas]ELS24011.1 Transcriptional regulator, TetR family [Pseudomonas furukawaii]OWJ92381.1 TetR family transcriptional regulator [Pseudomonas sp. A46]WAG77294.1 TetR/AcrR family transcriptional regulator [Pseudomonas furukawaii]BAU75291.1 transcriptional regulator [Pseudomonas furukawaii]